MLPSGDELLQIHTPITNFELTGSSIQAVKESETFTVFRQDATQELALQKIKQGQSLVIQGPPGSGKSQLIANIVRLYGEGRACAAGMSETGGIRCCL